MNVETFTVPVIEDEAEWVRRRVEDFCFFEEPDDAGWRYGANRGYMERLRARWLGGFDWPAWVERLNRRPHFRARVPGSDLALHFIHRRSPRADAQPLLIAHGWPGSVLEFTHLIDRLAEPGEPHLPAFHVVAPSLPGYAWSDKPSRPLGPRAIAGLYDRLMVECLGYESYVAQGGDWGAVILGWLGVGPSSARAIHLNGFGLRCADMRPTTDDERAWLSRALKIRDEETAYLQLQGTKPQSLAYAMMDSPMGVAAWLAEKFRGWADPKDSDDPPFDMDWLLANVMIYLTTRSFATATWIYRGLFDEDSWAVPAERRIEIPVGIANFPQDLLAFPPRTMVERAYNVVHWSDMPRGGHFASVEEPELWLEDVRAFAANHVAD